mmetsp:Transcript_95898/g.213364  ORF Transcript_95898/g.213364 Transcript_95898/m.213364 type:complete len:207 (+) Transcript_95898:1428-2048(+)
MYWGLFFSLGRVERKDRLATKRQRCERLRVALWPLSFASLVVPLRTSGMGLLILRQGQPHSLHVLLCPRKVPGEEPRQKVPPILCAIATHKPEVRNQLQHEQQRLVTGRLLKNSPHPPLHCQVPQAPAPCLLDPPHGDRYCQCALLVGALGRAAEARQVRRPVGGEAEAATGTAWLLCRIILPLRVHESPATALLATMRPRTRAVS